MSKRARGSVDDNPNKHTISEFIGTLEPEATDNARVAAVFQMKADDIQGFMNGLSVEELKSLGDVRSVGDQAIRTVFAFHEASKALDVLFT